MRKYWQSLHREEEYHRASQALTGEVRRPRLLEMILPFPTAMRERETEPCVSAQSQLEISARAAPPRVLVFCVWWTSS